MESVNTVPFNSSVQDAESSGYERDCTFIHKITRQRIHIIVQECIGPLQWLLGFLNCTFRQKSSSVN
jgi:hypothetical protein